MKKEILTYPKDKEILTSKSEEVSEITEEIKILAQDLIDTLKSTTGCGISAVQIGVLKKVCVIKDNMNYIVMINPKITRSRGNVVYPEGCLSMPGIYKDVDRAQKVWCKYLDEN